MSGLYNMLFGQNPAAGTLLAMLDLTPQDVGRFRDCFPNPDGTRIIVYTRNGGGHREEYGPVLAKLAQHPNWVRDWDDSFDCTYASIEFTVPDQFEQIVKSIADQTDTRSPDEKWATSLADLKAGKDTAVTARAHELGKRLADAINSGKNATISTPEGSVVLQSFPLKEPEEKKP